MFHVGNLVATLFIYQMTYYHLHSYSKEEKYDLIFISSNAIKEEK